MFIYLVLTVFICASARHMATTPKVTSWPEADAIPEIYNTFENAYSHCKHIPEFFIAFVSNLFCQSNSMDLRCDADQTIMFKLASDATLSTSEILEICTTERKKKPEYTENCKHNMFITLTNLVCDHEQYHKEADALTTFAMTTDKLLPLTLERIKTDNMTDTGKWKLMRAFLRNQPRLLYGAFITRENAKE